MRTNSKVRELRPPQFLAEPLLVLLATLWFAEPPESQSRSRFRTPPAALVRAPTWAVSPQAWLRRVPPWMPFEKVQEVPALLAWGGRTPAGGKELLALPVLAFLEEVLQ